MATSKAKKKKSAKRVKLGKQIASTLPRNEQGRFLPRGSKNLFRKKRGSKRKFTLKPKKSKRKTKRSTLRAADETAKRRKRVGGIRRTDEFANFIVATQEIAAGLSQKKFQSLRVATPLPRIKTSGNKATILEILWVEFSLPTLILNFDVVQLGFIRIQLSIGSPPIDTILPFSDPRVFAEVQVDHHFKEADPPGPNVREVNTSSLLIQPFRYELQTRGTGAGYLLTAEAFNFSMEALETNAEFPVTADIKVWYRFVDVPLDEFVGLVQSTQQA